MQRRDRRLNLIGAGTPVAHRLVDQRQPLGDHPVIPEPAILVLQQHDGAIGIEPRRRPRMLEQKQGRQPHDFRLRLEQPKQQPGEPDRLFAQGRAGRGLAAAGRIAFVEDEVDHRHDGGEPFRPLLRPRRFERHIGLGDAGFRPRDALLHGALAHQERPRDLLDRQAGNDAQRQRYLLGRRQIGMAADEEETQDVVAVMRPVEPFRDGLLGIVRYRRSGRPAAAVPACSGAAPHRSRCCARPG